MVGSRRGSAPDHHGNGILESALGRLAAFPKESRPFAPAVGYAPQPRSGPAAARTLHDSVSVSPIAAAEAELVARRRRGEGRPAQLARRIRDRPARLEKHTSELQTLMRI